jgi:hypothetical protein
MPSLGFCFDQFACEMLLKPSQATSLVDLQAEFNQLAISSQVDGMAAVGAAFDNPEEKKASGLVDLDWPLDKYLSK